MNKKTFNDFPSEQVAMFAELYARLNGAVACVSKQKNMIVFVDISDHDEVIHSEKDPFDLSRKDLFFASLDEKSYNDALKESFVEFVSQWSRSSDMSESEGYMSCLSYAMEFSLVCEQVINGVFHQEEKNKIFVPDGKKIIH